MVLFAVGVPSYTHTLIPATNVLLYELPQHERNCVAVNQKNETGNASLAKTRILESMQIVCLAISLGRNNIEWTGLWIETVTRGSKQ